MIPWEKDPDFGITKESEHPMTTKTKGTIGPVSTSAASGTGVAGSAAILIVWLLGLFGVDMPEPVAMAVAVLLGAIGALYGGKLVPPSTGLRAAE